MSRGAPSAVGVYGVGLKVLKGWQGDEATWGTSPTEHRQGSDPLTVDPDDEFVRGTIGGGFFIDEAGFIVTAGHVVAHAKDIMVELHDQRVLRAELVGHDNDTDIALLKVALPTPMKPLLGRSIGLRAGDWVLAVGAPYGLDRSVVAGIVSGMNRHFLEDVDSVFIQTDVALGPGNSGGPLFDSSGAVVGMNARVVVGGFGSPGLGLSIPIEVVLQIAAELRHSSHAIVRPRLGANFSDVSPPVALKAGRPYANGALVRDVKPSGLGHTMGLRVGDIVTAMNDQPVGDSSDLARMLLAWRKVPGTRMVVFREGRYLPLELK